MKYNVFEISGSIEDSLSSVFDEDDLAGDKFNEMVAEIESTIEPYVKIANDKAKQDESE